MSMWPRLASLELEWIVSNSDVSPQMFVLGAFSLSLSARIAVNLFGYVLHMAKHMEYLAVHRAAIPQPKLYGCIMKPRVQTPVMLLILGLLLLALLLSSVVFSSDGFHAEAGAVLLAAAAVQWVYFGS